MTGDEKKERKAEKIIENEEPPDVKITKALCKTNIFSETLRKRKRAPQGGKISSKFKKYDTAQTIETNADGQLHQIDGSDVRKKAAKRKKYGTLLEDFEVGL